MKIRLRIISVLILLIGIILPTALFADEIPARVKSVRLGCNSEGVRIVVDSEGSCIHQIHSLSDSSVITLDLFNAELAEDFRHPAVKQDNLIESVRIKQVNHRQAEVEVKLKYGIPIDNVHCFTLDNPRRITVDIYRDYNNFTQFNITRNIIWLQTERAYKGAFTLINEIYVNHRSPDVDVRVETGKGSNGRETVDAMVSRTGAVAGINGGYFGNQGQHLGLLIIDGKIAASTVKTRPPRTAFAIDFDGRILFDQVSDVKDKIITIGGDVWKDIVLAVGAGPRLIRNGRVQVTALQEALGKGGNDITRKTGRSAVGVDKKGNLVFMTASAFRDNHRDGVKLEEMARYMKSRHVTNGMNLDGGGSTAMSVMGVNVSKPPMQGNYQRPVANAILFFDKSPVISPRLMGVEPAEIILPADGESAVELSILVTDADEKPVPDKTPVSITPGAGMVEKKYHYTKNGLIRIKVKSVRAPGSYTLKIDCGPLRRFVPLRLTSGDSARIYPKLSALKTEGAGEKEKKFIVKALVTDSWQNGLGRKAVNFELLEGEGSLSETTSLTRPDGTADATLTLKSDRGKIRFSSEGVEPIVAEVN